MLTSPRPAPESWPGGPGAVHRHLDLPARHRHADRHRAAGRVPGGVGQRLLHDPVHRRASGRGQRRGVPVDGQADVGPGLAELGHQPRDLVQSRHRRRDAIRAGRVTGGRAQQPDRGPDLGQALPAQPLGLGQRPRRVGRVVLHRQPRARHVQQRHGQAVRDDVVQLPGDAVALLGAGSLGQPGLRRPQLLHQHELALDQRRAEQAHGHPGRPGRPAGVAVDPQVLGAEQQQAGRPVDDPGRDSPGQRGPGGQHHGRDPDHVARVAGADQHQARRGHGGQRQGEPGPEQEQRRRGGQRDHRAGQGSRRVRRDLSHQSGEQRHRERRQPDPAGRPAQAGRQGEHRADVTPQSAFAHAYMLALGTADRITATARPGSPPAARGPMAGDGYAPAPARS